MEGRRNILKNKYRFSVYLMLLLLSLTQDQSAYGARKGARKSMRMTSKHALEKYKEKSCPASGKTQDAINSLKDFHADLGRKIEELYDSLANTLEEQNRCLEEKENERDEKEVALKNNLTTAIEEQKRCLQERERDKQKKDIPPTITESDSVRACDDSRCKELSAKMLDLISHSADPCEDFYEYACGGVESDVHLSPVDVTHDVNRRLLKTLDEMEKNNSVMGSARTFHDACLEWRRLPPTNESVLTYAKKVVRDVGWFLPDNPLSLDQNMSYIPSASNLTYLLANFMKSEFTPFFDISVEPDASNSKHFLPRISLALESQNMMSEIDQLTCISDFTRIVIPPYKNLSKLDLNEEYEKYRSCMKSKGLERKLNRMVEAITAMGLMDHIPDTVKRADLLQSTKMATELLLSSINDVLPLEAEIKTAYLHKNYQINSLANFDTVFGNQIDWEDFFFILTGKHLDTNQTVLVYHQKELAEMITILSAEWGFSPSTTQNSLLMLWSERVYSHLVSPLDVNPDYCLQATKTLLPDVSSALYIHSFPDVMLTRIQRDIKRKVSDLKKKLKSLIIGGDSDEVAAIQRKIEDVKVNVGAIADKDSLEEITKGIKLSSNHASNVDFLLRRHRSLLYGLLDQYTDSPTAMWIQGVLPFDKKGVVVHETNSIYVPVGVFAPPYLYYRKRLPDYIFYGGLGHLVAELLVHFIDSTGLKFNGAEKEWLSVTSTPLISASECLSEQLNSGFVINNLPVQFKMPTPNFKLDNLISNSGATRLAWSTYFESLYESSAVPSSYTESPEEPLIWLGKEPLPPIQAYFLRIAQTQCSSSSQIHLLDIMENEELIPRHKINLVMKNEPLFAKAFQCSSSSKMNPKIKCPFLDQPVV